MKVTHYFDCNNYRAVECSITLDTYAAEVYIAELSKDYSLLRISADDETRCTVVRTITTEEPWFFRNPDTGEENVLYKPSVWVPKASQEDGWGWVPISSSTPSQAALENLKHVNRTLVASVWLPFAGTRLSTPNWVCNALTLRGLDAPLRSIGLM